MKTLAILIKLVIAHHLKRRARALLAVLGIAASVCLVVWILRGYQTAARGPAGGSAQDQGRYDVVVAPPMPQVMPGGGRGQAGGPPRRPPPSTDTASRFVDERWMEALGHDPAVARIARLVSTRVRVVDRQPTVPMGPFSGGTLVGTAETEPPVPLGAGEWLTPGHNGQTVVSAGFADRYALKCGDEITVGGNGGELRLKVVGVLKGAPGGGMGPMGPSPAGDMQVGMGAAQQINGFKDRINTVAVELKDRETAADFAETWSARSMDGAPPVSFRALRQGKGNDMDNRMLMMVKAQADNATALSFLAACFIIFATLSGGIRERLRELAAMRAVALSRTQLVAMILIEAALLATAGWLLGLLVAKLATPLGVMLAVRLELVRGGMMTGSALGWTAVWTSGACAIIGSLAAAVLTAWQAVRFKPLDILGQSGGGSNRRAPWIMVSIGILLVIANPVAVLLAGTAPLNAFFSKIYTMGFGPPLLACAAMIVGLALVTPGVIVLIEKLCSPLLARLLGLDPRFLRQQLSGNLWRTVGTTIALSSGLTLFVTALVWGYSMLVPFTPDKSLPRMLVSVLPAGIPENAVDEIRNIDGVIPDQCLAMSVEQPRLTDSMLASKAFESVDVAQQHLLFMGVDTAKAFGGTDPVLGFTFVQGDRETAARKLREGRYCLVPDHFHTQTGLGVGDKFAVAVPNKPGEEVSYEIAGVVYVPGWNWFTKFAEIRRRAGRALAMVFADYQQVKTDFKLDNISFFWMNVDERVSWQEMEKRLGPVADKFTGVRANVPGMGDTMVNKQYIKITERNDLIARLNQRADSVIWALTRFPLIALVITSLAVFNTVFASVRSRFWQFGILRGVGMSRWQMFRLVISESLMIFLASGLMSLGSGVLLAWSGTRICTFFFFFAGRTPPLVLPWAGLSLGFGIAFGLCLLAGLIPAWRMSRREPLSFIQAGRLAQ
ncbi:MAG: FtsX-like permease family protein [Verrucomicrobia bacterium]|nr:FtsX-like permease family protein [Verrucomicrobiota bacterium]